MVSFALPTSAAAMRTRGLAPPALAEVSAGPSRRRRRRTLPGNVGHVVRNVAGVKRRQIAARRRRRVQVDDADEMSAWGGRECRLGDTDRRKQVRPWVVPMDR